MNEVLLANAILAERRADDLPGYYRRQWNHMSAMANLEKQRKSHEKRLGLQAAWVHR
jgi:hypothetical protein